MRHHHHIAAVDVDEEGSVVAQQAANLLPAF
jgi:hypothetical protein